MQAQQHLSKIESATSAAVNTVLGLFQRMSLLAKLSKPTLAFACLGGLAFYKREIIAKYLMSKMCLVAYNLERLAYQHRRSLRPTKIILVRHGQSLANINDQVYAQMPDNQIPLTEVGKAQANEIGVKLANLIGKDKNVVFFVSPFKRAQETAKEILTSFSDCSKKIITEPRIREQEWGNLQKFQKHPEKCRQIYAERNLVGRFYYRFETGESASDVYDRATMFLETLFREMDSYACAQAENGKERVVVLVTHGMVMRLINMRYFKKSIEEFDQMSNPKNCEAWVLNRTDVGTYYFNDKIFIDSATSSD